jgi:hypothetical protein
VLPIGTIFVWTHLTSGTKNTCNWRLRSPLPDILIGNGRCGGEVGVELAALMGNGRQTKTVTDGGPCNRS